MRFLLSGHCSELLWQKDQCAIRAQKNSVWGLFAWVYLRRRTHRERSKVRSETRREAVALETFWLAAAVAVDYVFFVLIKNPLSLTPHDFYVGQFPWIYLIYAAIFLATLATLALSSPRRVTQI